MLRQTIEAFDENWHSSELQRNPGHVQLWQYVRDPLDGQQAAACRSLRGVPPVLYGQAEDRRHRRPRREVPAALRNQNHCGHRDQDRPEGGVTVTSSVTV